MVAPRIMLWQILAAWPAPAPPQWTMRLPIFSRIGFARANASSEPPHMKVSVPPLAPPTPPETGASRVSAPAASPASCALRALSTSMVEQSMTRAPFGVAGRRSAWDATPWRPAGSIVTTVSALATASRALGAMATPDAAAAVFAASTRSKPATECPALTRFAAIGAPMLPRPMNAILDMGLPFARKRSSEAQARTGRSYHLAADRKSRDEASAREFVLEVRPVQQTVSVIREFVLCKPRGNSRWSDPSAHCLARRNPMPPQSVKTGSGLGPWDVSCRGADMEKQKRPVVLVVEDEPLVLMDALDLVTGAGFEAIGA